MALSCPIGLDVERLKEEVSKIYARVASDPGGEFHFHRGLRYAVEMLGYSEAELRALPEEATAPFAGVANPHAIAPIEPGSVVLDIGSGAGMDLLLAAKHVGPAGRAIGVDVTPEMIARARAAAASAGATNVEIREGSAEALPAESASVDVVISNGVLNLAADKARAFSEIVRVLRPGGRLQLGDIVVASELSERIRSDIDLWTG
jgi:arsenite methyltransferase